MKNKIIILMVAASSAFAGNNPNPGRPGAQNPVVTFSVITASSGSKETDNTTGTWKESYQCGDDVNDYYGVMEMKLNWQPGVEVYVNVPWYSLLGSAKAYAGVEGKIDGNLSVQRSKAMAANASVSTVSIPGTSITVPYQTVSGNGSDQDYNSENVSKTVLQSTLHSPTTLFEGQVSLSAYASVHAEVVSNSSTAIAHAQMGAANSSGYTPITWTKK